MARTGPVTRDTTTVALGLAQIRVGASATYVSNAGAALSKTDSMGAMASTKYTGKVDYWKLESGFPKMEDLVIPLSVSAQLDCSFKEVSPKNLAYAMGKDASTGYTTAHSGEIGIGDLVAPAYIRMEAVYTFPNGTDTMTILFPRAQATSSIEMDFKDSDAVAVPVTFEAKRADSEVSGGNAVWDAAPLGKIIYA
jgi:hypothetical protein